MTEYEKLRDWVRSQGYTYEECDEGMIIIRPDFVAVVAYWEWSDLLTTIYMTHEVYEQMVSDMASVKSKNKLSPPVFAMTYGYGLVDVADLEDLTLNAFPFDGWLSGRISDDYFQYLIDLIQNQKLLILLLLKLPYLEAFLFFYHHILELLLLQH